VVAGRDERDGLSQLNEMFYYKPLGSSGSATPPAAPTAAEPIAPTATAPSPAPVPPQDPPRPAPAARRRRRPARIIVPIVVLLVILGGAGGYAGWALNAPISPATASWHAPDVDPGPAAKILAPADGETAISIAGGGPYLAAVTASVPATTGAQDAVPIASISKLVTAMVVLDAKPLADANDAGPTITFTAADHALYDHYYSLGCVIAPMPTGSTMTEQDALKTMLVISACNYAEAVANWAFGSEAAAVSATRTWLAKNGLTHTTIVEPTGIDDRDRSTPADVIALGKLAKANPAIASIVNEATLDVSSPALDGIDKSSTNTLLGENGVDGIKTGTLDAGSDLLYSSTLDVAPGQALTIVGVVLDGASHESVDDDVERLLVSIKSGFHSVSLGSYGDELGTYTTKWGASAKIMLDDSPTVLTWSDTPVTSSMTVHGLTTGKNGQKVGTVTWKAGAATVTASAVLDGTITAPTAWWRLTHPFDLG
jgi:serine-type D-Ala-D-Ala carboxypeptidase (penicillin-binding protein 5/6)